MTSAVDRLWTRLERLPLARRTKRTVAQIRAVAVEVGALIDAIWRRSLQVRVVVSTLALSAAVVLVLGLVLQTQIAGRILQGKEVDALGQAEAGAAVLERELAGVDPDGEGAQGELNKALDRLTNASLADDTGSPSAGEFRAVLTTGLRQPGGGVDGAGADEVSAGTVADVPADLRGHVADGSLARRYVTIMAQGVEIPTLIIGQPVRTAGRDLEFYLLFPLDAEQRTLVARAEHADRRRARAPAAAGRDRQPGHPAGRPARSGRRRRSPSGSPTVTSTSACPCTATTRWPGWPSRTTRWPAASRRRSASSRSSARCSGGSPPTSATSCAPR